MGLGLKGLQARPKPTEWAGAWAGLGLGRGLHTDIDVSARLGAVLTKSSSVPAKPWFVATFGNRRISSIS